MRQISPVLEERLKLHNQTIENNADPRVSVQVTRARSAVMDSTYWTVETIRTKAGIGDISVAARRLKAYGRPDRLYEIHVDNGIVKTTIREYPDRLKDGWQPQFELGAGSAVAIAFDGEWELWRGKWRLKTTEKPWIMWVDGTGKLFAQLWDEIDTRVELATGVVSCRAIRGWKTLTAENRDQGIVVGYIKADGKVYYRQYIQFLDLSYTWDQEHELTDFTGTAESLNLFIVNDFRLGFVVSDSLKNVYWYITYRNYSAITTGRDVISLKTTQTYLTLDIGEIETLLYQAPQDTIAINNIRAGATMSVYEEVVADHVLSITGIVIDATHFDITFNTDSVWVWNPDNMMHICPDYTMESIVIDGNIIHFTTVEDIDTLGFVFTTGASILVWKLGREQGFVPEYDVQVLGEIPPLEETISLAASPLLTLSIFEITKHPYTVYPQDTIALSALKVITLTINEASTDPV